MNLFTKLFCSLDKPQNRYHFSGWPFVFGKSAAGAKVNKFTAMQTTAVYACVRILAESIARLPLYISRDGFRETAMIFLLLWGIFSQIIRGGMRRVVGLYPLLPNRMSVG